MAKDHSADGFAARADETGQLLVRSGIEIGQTLEAMRAAGTALSVDLDLEEHLFVSRLLEVDLANGTMTMGWSESKEANALVMARSSLTFSANHESLHYRFVARDPREANAAIQFSLPVAMLAVQRRESPRYKVPPTVPLRCEISLGPMSFDAQVVDLGQGGLGAIVYVVKRAGCRFIASGSGIEALVRLFLAAVEPTSAPA